MTKKARIAELERRIEQLETELAELRLAGTFIDARSPTRFIVCKPADVGAVRHAIGVTLGFPSVGEPDGMITSLL